MMQFTVTLTSPHLGPAMITGANYVADDATGVLRIFSTEGDRVATFAAGQWVCIVANPIKATE